jgi:type II secretory pathway pseudopilin PulG
MDPTPSATGSSDSLGFSATVDVARKLPWLDTVKIRTANDDGYLLIEMLVVVAILGIALLGILAQSSDVVRGNRLSEQTAAATSLGQAKIEELKATDFDELRDQADPSPVTARGEAGGIFSRSVEITDLGDLNGIPAKKIRVTVRWPELGSMPSVSLSTLVINLPTYAPDYPTVVQRSWRRG